jgi:hypothetical protein
MSFVHTKQIFFWFKINKSRLMKRDSEIFFNNYSEIKISWKFIEWNKQISKTEQGDSKSDKGVFLSVTKNNCSVC